VCPAETLAAASGQNLERLFKRQARRQGKGAPVSVLQPALAAGRVAGLPAQRQQQQVGACGAAAVTDLDAEEQAGGGTAAEGKEDEEPTQQQQLEQQQGQQEQGSEEEEEDWEDAWAELEGSEEGAGTAAGGEEEGEGDDEEEQEGGLTITLQRDGSEEGAAGGKGKGKPRGGSAAAGGVKRRGVNKADREQAQMVHRSHLLCLLGRGLMHDAAASDPLLQAQLLSLLPDAAAAWLHHNSGDGTGGGGSDSSGKGGGSGGGGGGSGCSMAGLRAQLKWFRSVFKLQPGSLQQQQQQQKQQEDKASTNRTSDPVLAALLSTRGLQGLVGELQEAVQQRSGTCEQLVTLFAALLRAQGATVRSVRALGPSSLKPTGKPWPAPAGGWWQQL
jgi:hypothetical protein